MSILSYFFYSHRTIYNLWISIECQSSSFQLKSVPKNTNLIGKILERSIPSERKCCQSSHIFKIANHMLMSKLKLVRTQLVSNFTPSTFSTPSNHESPSSTTRLLKFLIFIQLFYHYSVLFISIINPLKITNQSRIICLKKQAFTSNPFGSFNL